MSPSLSARAREWGFEALLGFSIALVLCCVGLWQESRDPRLPGVRISAQHFSMVTDLGFASAALNNVPD